MQKRTVVAFSTMLLMLCGIMLRVYQLTSGSLAQAADQQASMTVQVASARGTIYDRNLVPLVNTEKEYRAAVAPTSEAVAALSDCLMESQQETVLDRLQKGQPAVALLSGLTPPTEGISLVSAPVRYGKTVLAPHVVGYLSGDGINGAAGIEQAYNDWLNACGGEATVTYSADAMGKPLQDTDPKLVNTLDNAKAGVVLTLDADIQKITERVAKNYIQKGAVLVMEPSSGQILSMVSLPDYQPDTVAESLENEDSPLLNRALCNYNCGSVFKIVSAAAALEAGVSTEYSYTCTGKYSIEELNFHCHNRLGHGQLNMLQAFGKSCNPYFINLMQQVGGEKLYDMAVTLGFDRPIVLAEGLKTARAVLPTEEDLRSPAEVANLSFGQGSLLATPVHMAQLVGTVVNGGELVRPTLYRGTVDKDGILQEAAPTAPQHAFSENTAAILRQMMAYTIEEGTGTKAKPIEGGAGAKTGTAETGWEEDGQEVIQSWIAGYYPAEDPQYVIVVLEEDADESAAHTSAVFKQLCEEFCMLEKVKSE